MKSRVLIVINSLHSGGAEKTCIELARYLNGECDLDVVSLVIGGPAEQELRLLGVKVTVMEAVGMRQKLLSCFRLARILREKKPDTVITFLYIADLVGGILARVLVPKARVFWNIRNNVLTRCQTGLSSFAISRLNGLVSRFVPHRIVYCSPVARAQHESIGFRCDESCVVENSVRSVPYVFSSEKRNRFRQASLGEDFVFLFVGRFDPVKRVDVYIDACIEFFRQHGGSVRFVLAGRGMDRDNPWIKAKLESSGIAERFQLLGFVADQQGLYSAADCLIVTSESEGSPNAVYEAMATRLQVIIFGTIGTENLAGEGVYRMETRCMDRLVATMGEVVSRGLPAPSHRFPAHGVDADVDEHPLVTYYKRALAR